MPFFKHCVKCGRRRIYTSKRSIVVPRVHPKPITTPEELCGKCWDRIKRTVKLVK